MCNFYLLSSGNNPPPWYNLYSTSSKTNFQFQTLITPSTNFPQLMLLLLTTPQDNNIISSVTAKELLPWQLQLNFLIQPQASQEEYLPFKTRLSSYNNNVRKIISLLLMTISNINIRINFRSMNFPHLSATCWRIIIFLTSFHLLVMQLLLVRDGNNTRALTTRGTSPRITIHYNNNMSTSMLFHRGS